MFFLSVRVCFCVLASSFVLSACIFCCMSVCLYLFIYLLAFIRSFTVCVCFSRCFTSFAAVSCCGSLSQVFRMVKLISVLANASQHQRLPSLINNNHSRLMRLLLQQLLLQQQHQKQLLIPLLLLLLVLMLHLKVAFGEHSVSWS